MGSAPVMRTLRPSVLDSSRQRSATGPNPSVSCRLSHSSTCSSRRAHPSGRACRSPLSRSRLVATGRSSSGKSCICSETLTPTPSTAWRTRSGSARSSVSRPAILRPLHSTSLGHLIRALPAPISRAASAAATAAAMVISGARAGAIAGRSTTENVSALPRGATQLRPRRPRPRVWKSATTTSPCRAPASARRWASSLVDSSSA